MEATYEKLTLQRDSIEDTCRATAGALARAYATGEISPVEVVESALIRAQKVNEALNAFCIVDREGALKAAKESETRWRSKAPLSPIDGIPTTIKDLVYCSLDVRYGSRVTGDVSDRGDSPSVERLRKSGAVVLGLTNTPEFGWKAVTDSLRNGITRNPWDDSKTPGGSSGGAAVAAATGAGVLHLGTDGGGSIRIPAAFCGVVGHKPSFGRVPAYPPSPFGTVAHVGPIARCVEDVVLMLNVMSARDLRDWTQPLSPPKPVELKPVHWNGARIALWGSPCVGALNGEVEAAIRSITQDLEYEGAEVTETELPEQESLLEVFCRHWYVGAANRLSEVNDNNYSLLDPGFLDAAIKGCRYTAVERMQAEVTRARFGAQMDSLLQEYDYIVSPAVAVPPFEAGVDVPRDSNYESWIEWSSFSFPINLSQQPACSVPCGQTKTGLPIGLQIIGARGKDNEVLSAAFTLERMYPERLLSPNGAWLSRAKDGL